MRIVVPGGEGVVWHSPRAAPFRLAGFPWIERDGKYRRLPLSSQTSIREPVHALADCTAGGQIRFTTDSPFLHLSVKLTAPADMYHMPATGQCGFDCYVGGPRRKRYVGTTKFRPGADAYESVLFEGFDRRKREVTIHFPLYQGVEEVYVGLAKDASIASPGEFDDDGRIVFYGTSITQGGCASRPGMAYPNIVGRRLNLECVNLGFSGNGKGEAELARIIRGIDRLKLLVLDYEPNVSLEQFQETLPVFVDLLRSEHPALPILVVSGIKSALGDFQEAVRLKRELCRDFARDFVLERRSSGDLNLRFLNGDALLGRRYEECTVDGVHPTDLGFQRMSDAMAKAIRSMLAMKG
ncbi:hypothetical protein FE782_18840 [Paenibacillus antri]|uniref:Hydrolase n=2 Tax=Paenibacillus antri TaxID=2582848 RepID=A0A5R9G385_9BACL|nr:hypothetical protein FE782_18840 [Paenibacillus antri]